MLKKKLTMTKFENREEYEKWKAEKLSQKQEAKEEMQMNTGASLSNVEYAGFWKRLAAYLIDIIVLNIAVLALGYILLVLVVTNTPGNASAMGYGLGYILGLIIPGLLWLYFSLMESSSKQAPLGKMVLGIIVTDHVGGRISKGRAMGRNLAKVILSFILFMGVFTPIDYFTAEKQALEEQTLRGITIFSLFMIIAGLPGFIKAGFTAKKRALHDIMAGTLVVVKR